MGLSLFWIVFSVFVIAILPVLWFYARRHSNPRLRPRVGEVALLGLLLTMISAGAAYLVSGIFGAQEFTKKASDAGKANSTIPGSEQAQPAQQAPANLQQ